MKRIEFISIYLLINLTKRRNTEMIKKEINIKEVRNYERKSYVFTILKIAMLILFFPMAIVLETNGIIIWIVLTIITITFDFRNEKTKIENDKRTTRRFDSNTGTE